MATPQPADNPLLTAALVYAARGWYVFPLHGRGRVTLCDCGDEACASPAKHPWTRNGLKDASVNPKQIREWWRKWPRANIGVATGASGLVVLDIDPRHGGDSALGELARRYAQAHGQRVATPLVIQAAETLVSATGGGGWHYIYRAPVFDDRAKVIRNKQHLDGLDGLDVRGVGGYIVAPPSLHANEAQYLWQNGSDTANGVAGELGSVPTAPAPIPAWLLEILTRSNAQPAAATATTPVRMLPDAGDRRDGGKFWLERALTTAREGNRNEVGFWMACQLRDDGVSRAEAEGLMLAYALNVAQGHTTYTEAEALRSLAQAYNRAPRESARSQNAASAPLRPERSADDSSAEADAMPAAEETPAPRRFQLLSDEQVEQMPPPEWLIGGFLVANTLAVLYGEFGSYKSFLALDWALSVATGTPWCGQPTKQGRVVYVAGEGIGGLGQRLRAWKLTHEWQGSAPIHLLGVAPQLLRAEDAVALRETIGDLPEPPALIVIDTVARSMVGGDENSAQDMGILVAAADMLRAATSANVVLIHHKPKGANTTRGSSALPGGADTLIDITKDDLTPGVITVHCEKQKDAAPFEDRRLRFEVKVLDDAATETSGVLLPDVTPVGPRRPTLPASARRVLGILQASSGLYWADLRARFTEQYGMSASAFDKAVSRLEDDGFVENVGGLWRVKEDSEASE